LRPAAIRRVYDLTGHRLTSLDELQNHGIYMCVHMLRPELHLARHQVTGLIDECARGGSVVCLQVLGQSALQTFSIQH
jgi:hypothetical protein